MATTTETTITVPAEYAEDFRAAVVEEIATEAKYVRRDRKEAAVALAFGDRALADRHATDAAMARRLLAWDARLLADVEAADEGDLELSIVDDDDGTLAHVFETVARKIVSPQIARVLDCTPIDEEAADELRELTTRLSWAIDTAARLHRAGMDARMKATA